jgi:hypothetical protein
MMEAMNTHQKNLQNTTPYTLEQNGISKRKNKAIFDVVLNMLHHSHFSTT